MRQGLDTDKRAALRSTGAAGLRCGVIALILSVACGDPTLLNPAFINQSQGGLFPLVPGPDANLILVRAVNSTNERLTFLVTVERATLVTEGDEVATITATETFELFTLPSSFANEAGVMFECTSDQSISRIGLGRNLNQPQTDPGLFVGGLGDIIPGFGVPANINPLSSEFVDFRCGDTIIFQAIQAINEPGGFKVKAFVLPFETQPAETVRNTFQVAADFLNDRPTEDR